MAIDYTVTGLLASIRRRGMIPTSSEALADSDLIALANEEMHGYVLPLLMRTNEEYLVSYSDLAITASDARYSIPERAIGNKVRDVLYLDGGTYRSLSRIEPEFADQYGDDTGTPSAFYLEGHEIVLLPTPSEASTLRVKYYKRPGDLTTTFTFVSAFVDPDYTVGSTSGFTDQDVDFVSADSPFQPVYSAIPIEVRSATAFEPADPVTSALVLGTYMVPAGDSPFPQIPAELHPLLAQRVVVRALEALGDPRVEAAAKRCDQVKQDALALLTPRHEGTGRKVINYNGPGWRRGTSRFRS